MPHFFSSQRDPLQLSLSAAAAMGNPHLCLFGVGWGFMLVTDNIYWTDAFYPTFAA